MPFQAYGSLRIILLVKVTMIASSAGTSVYEQSITSRVCLKGEHITCTPCTGASACRACRCFCPHTPCTGASACRACRCYCPHTPCTGPSACRACRCYCPHTAYTSTCSCRGGTIVYRLPLSGASGDSPLREGEAQPHGPPFVHRCFRKKPVSSFAASGCAKVRHREQRKVLPWAQSTQRVRRFQLCSLA